MAREKYSSPEIERRWLVQEDRLPALPGARRREIEDRYIHGGRLRLRTVRAEGVDPIFKLGKKYPRAGTDPEHVVSIYLSEEEHETLRGLLEQSPERLAIPSKVARSMSMNIRVRVQSSSRWSSRARRKPQLTCRPISSPKRSRSMPDTPGTRSPRKRSDTSLHGAYAGRWVDPLIAKSPRIESTWPES